MTKTIYKLSREFVLIAGIIVTAMVWAQDYYLRGLMNIILVVLYVIFSRLYEKKNDAITTGYIYVTFVIAITNTLFACFFTPKTIAIYNQMGVFGYFSGDYYNIYFFGVFLTYLFILMYLLTSKADISKKRATSLSIGTLEERATGLLMGTSEENNLAIGTGLLIVVFIISGRNYEVYIPLAVTAICNVIFGKNKARNSAILILVLALGIDIILSRFKLIQIVLPLILMFLLKRARGERNMSMIKINAYFVLGIVGIIVYGVVSEIVKLNIGWGGNYTISAVLRNNSLLEYFIVHQLYRIFFIWIKLGGYIIDHVQQNGYFYGATYIKLLAPIMDFDYVSLPKIGAVYDRASYAQPGLLAEGYANFGIIGIPLNLFLVFMLMEYLKKLYKRKPSFDRLIIAAVPFSKIILDGGTLNSAIALLFICLILDLPRTIRKNRADYARKVDSFTARSQC